MYADVYEMVQPAVSGSKSFGKKRFKVRKRPTNPPAKRDVNAKAGRGRAYSLNHPHRSRSRRNASPSPLLSRKWRKGSQNPVRRLGSLYPRKRTKLKSSSIIRQIDEFQESLRRLGEASGVKIPERTISLATPPLGRSLAPLDRHTHTRRSDSPLQYLPFPIQRSPSPYYTSASVPPPTRSPTLAQVPNPILGLPPVPYWSLSLIKTPRPSRSLSSADLRSHTQRSLSQDRRSSQNCLDERPPKGHGDSGDAANIFEDRDAEMLLPYGSPELKNADTDDLEGLTMDALKRRLAETLTDLEIEKAHRLEVDRILCDVERECRQPCVVPSLILAAMDFPSFQELLP